MTERRAKHPRTVVIDTSALLRFLDLDRADLLGRHPCTFVAPEEVEGEIKRADQVGRFRKAVSNKHVFRESISSRAEDEIFMRLVHKHRQGVGESSAIAIALVRKYSVATEDREAAIHANRLARERNVTLPVFGVGRILADLVRDSILDVPQADAMILDLKRRHGFDLGIDSVSSVLAGQSAEPPGGGAAGRPENENSP